MKTHVWIPSIHVKKKKSGVVLCVKSNNREAESDRRIPGACWPASLAKEVSSSSNERFYLKK